MNVDHPNRNLRISLLPRRVPTDHPILNPARILNHQAMDKDMLVILMLIRIMGICTCQQVSIHHMEVMEINLHLLLHSIIPIQDTVSSMGMEAMATIRIPILLMGMEIVEDHMGMEDTIILPSHPMAVSAINIMDQVRHIMLHPSRHGRGGKVKVKVHPRDKGMLVHSAPPQLVPVRMPMPMQAPVLIQFLFPM